MGRSFEEQDRELANAIQESEPNRHVSEVRAQGDRRHQRRPIVAAVTFESDNNFYTGVTGDIGEGGIFIASDSLPPVGAEVTVLLSLAGQARPWVIRGSVRWIRDRFACGPSVSSGFGVQFKQVSSEALAAIADFVAHRRDVLCDV